MKRRAFLQGLIAISGAVLTAQAKDIYAGSRHVGSHIHSRQWTCDAYQEALSHWWEVRMQHLPTGVRYGWRVSDQYLVKRGLTIEEFMRRQRDSMNPYFATHIARAHVTVG